MSAVCFQLKRKNALFHLKFEFVSQNKYWLYLSISVEINESTRYNKKSLEWMNEDSCFIQFKDGSCYEVLVKEHYMSF